MSYTYKLTEEIARWAFEVQCKNSKDWVVAFTNPTAGPWKTIKAADEDGNFGEVYRFALEEKRPDIVLYNDKLRVVLIVEAKDSLDKLIADEQNEKSTEVASNLAFMFSTQSSNRYWGKRSKYAVINGLLWGAEEIIGNPTVNQCRDEGVLI